MNVPYRPGDLWNPTTLNGLRHEELLEFAKRERIPPTLSNEEIIRQLLIRPPKEIPERWLRILARVSSEVETTRAMIVEPVEDHVSASGSQGRSKGLRTFPRPEYIEEADLPPRVVYKETENGFIANIVGARAGSSLIPVDTTGSKDVPTHAASVATTGRAVPAQEDVSRRPERRVFGILYEAEGVVMPTDPEGAGLSSSHSTQGLPDDPELSGMPSHRAGAPSPATVDVDRRLRPAPQELPSDPSEGPAPEVAALEMHGAALMMGLLERESTVDPHAMVPAHLDIPYVHHELKRADPIIFIDGDSCGDEQSTHTAQPITAELWESAPPPSLEGVEGWMVEEWQEEVEDEIFKPKIRLEPESEPEPVTKPVAPQQSTSMQCGSKRETIMGLMQMEIDDEDDVQMLDEQNAEASGSKRKRDNEGTGGEKRARARSSDVRLALKEAEDKSERSVGILARKMERAWRQRQQVEQERRELQALLDRKKMLAKTLEKKVKALKARKTFVEDVCLSTAMDRSMHVNVPAQEGPVAGSSRHANAYVEEGPVGDLTEFNLPPLVLKLNKPTDGAPKFKPNGRNAVPNVPLPKFHLG